MLKKVLVEVEEGTWKLLRAQAADEGCAVKDLVGVAFRRYLEAPRGAHLTAEGSVPVVSEVGTGRPSAAEVAALVNTVKPGSVVTGRTMLGGSKTVKQIEQEREARRADYEGESQDPRDYGF